MPDAGAVRQLFDELWSLPPMEREAKLRRHPQPAVAADVRRLLDAHDGGSILDRSPVEAWPGQATPENLGPYRIEGELGRGGMGVVYRASRSDDAYRKTVAVKVVGGGMPTEVFRRERQIMASLDHPNIARMYDGGATVSGALYFVMEYVEGEPLHKYLETAGLDARTRLGLFRQICRAVEYAHRHLVVHRDLKPGNVLVTREGVAKLLDFGIAKVLDPGPDSALTTLRSGMTPRYASPEQLTGKPVNTSSDIYSLGVILFEMLSGGMHPFEVRDQSLGGYLDAVLHREPRRLSQIVEVDRDLESVVAKAMAREVDLRYETVAQLGRDVDNYLAGLPVVARPASFGYRARKFAARNRALVALAGCLTLAVMGGVAATVRAYRIADRERTAAVRAANEARQLAEQREQLRLQAENHAAAAARERVRAETSARDALQQRDTAQQRLTTAQSLASSIIFEAYDGVRDLPGKADAKVRIVDKTLLHLERLLSQSPGDVKTIDLLANAYERAGDISSGASGEGIDNSGAVKYYRRSLDLREQAARAGGAGSPFQVPAARIRLALAIGRLLQGGEALAEARRAIQEFESLPAGTRATPEGKRARLTLYDFACELTAFNSLTGEALRFCKLASELAGSADPRVDPKALLVRGASWAKLSVLARNSNPAEAEAFLDAAADSYAAYLKAFPDSADAQRGLAVVAGRYAVFEDDSGQANAGERYEKALGALTRIVGVVGRRTQPEQILGWIHMRYARFLHRGGDLAGAREQARKSLAIYEARTSASSPTAVDLNDHADNLMKCPIPELQNPVEALRLARQAAALLKSPSVFILDTLANALYLNGRKDEAVATVKQALALLDEKPAPALRVEIEASLRKFLSGP